ncbi:MAG: energy transducer TonB [Methylacidiphilales bacterium]|nr:energy transducer TonB [Candidatus Methylacidiphilales bacterium]
MQQQDRFSVAIFLTATVHAFVIISIGFVSPKLGQSKTSTSNDSIQITNANDIENASWDTLANLNNLGSGTDPYAQEKTAPISLGIINNQGTVPNVINSQQEQKNINKSTLSIINDQQSPIYYYGTESAINHTTDISSTSTMASMNFSIALSTLNIELEKLNKADQQRTQTLSSSTTFHHFASYVHSWVALIEKIGNKNYPALALKNNITGDVILLVIIHRSGKLIKAQILKSSGQPILDQASIATIQKAAPFESFNKKQSNIADRVEIIRTFSYQGSHVTTRGLQNYR